MMIARETRALSARVNFDTAKRRLLALAQDYDRIAVRLQKRFDETGFSGPPNVLQPTVRAMRMCRELGNHWAIVGIARRVESKNYALGLAARWRRRSVCCRCPFAGRRDLLPDSIQSSELK